MAIYFPLTKKQSPTVAEIKKAWAPWKQRMAAVAERTNRPILLTEFGYRPVVGTTIEPWIWRDDKERSAESQLHAYEGALQALAEEPWFRGVYIWKWFANYAPGKKRGRPNGTFSPQGLPAEQAMFRWIKKLSSAGGAGKDSKGAAGAADAAKPQPDDTAKPAQPAKPTSGQPSRGAPTPSGSRGAGTQRS